MTLRKKIVTVIRRAKAYIDLYVYLLCKSVALSLAIALANFKQKAFNKRFFVILDHRDRLITLCNSDIKRLKGKGYLNKHLTHLELLENSFYYTAVSRNNDGRISEEERQRKRRVYYQYMTVRRRLALKNNPVKQRLFQRKK